MLKEIQEAIIGGIPALVVATMTAILLFLIAALMSKRRAASGFLGKRYRWQVLGLCVAAVGLIAFIIVLPIQDGTQNQLLTLLGLVLSAIITLASTTFVANAFASFMLRSVNSFRIGDFIRVGDHFGRVCERGLFHTEIQTEDRTLTTFPNLHLATHPFTVIRTSGTVISATVSLSYDVAHAKVEEALLAAAKAADLNEPFVQIMDLGDYAITYRAAGFLDNVRHLVRTRSALKRNMLSSLHTAGIEIVSPMFQNQRHIAAKRPVIPKDEEAAGAGSTDSVASAEKLMFDKAEEAEERDLLSQEHQQLVLQIEKLESELASAENVDERVRIMRDIVMQRTREQAIAKALECAQMLGDD